MVPLSEVVLRQYSVRPNALLLEFSLIDPEPSRMGRRATTVLQRWLWRSECDLGRDETEGDQEGDLSFDKSIDTDGDGGKMLPDFGSNEGHREACGGSWSEHLAEF